jgi:hypothetical protein
MFLLFMFVALDILEKRQNNLTSKSLLFFQTTKTARYYPNTVEVTRLALQKINNRTETQYSTNFFPIPK